MLWLLAYLGNVKTADFLITVGCLDSQSSVLCTYVCSVGHVIESANHLLVQCPSVWKIWCECLSWWGLEWVTPGSIEQLIQWWQSWNFRNLKKLLWEVYPMAIL